ncbi:MAG: NAD(P)(+) transhydrogenase (Re/Si-specific) subunit beta [Mycobacteriales bacterium]|nr:NAD(P)(+) transhydrogenase (Re/Si-specific) subunit beta [Mycobacteriales bacterium]
MSGFHTATHLVYLAVAACFVLGLHLMNSPRTARRGNLLSAAAMGVAVVTTTAVLVQDGTIRPRGVLVLSAGLLLGAAAGAWGARVVQLTDMPQLVSLFNAAGGGAAALVAFVDVVHRHGNVPSTSTVALAAILDVAIGALTLSGSLIAAGKLQGVISGNPVMFPGIRVVSGGFAAVVVVAGGVLYAGNGGTLALVAIGVAALGLGVTMVLPIGGADMPVVISLLNACTGSAVAMAGFMLDSVVLITAGALVGASGGILTRLMAVAMNRSLLHIVLGGFGTADTGTGAMAPSPGAGIRSTTADDVAISLAYASKVVVVPGYGLAAAQAQHEMAALAAQLTARGVEVLYAIHPVAGRMPGHMNVLLAEANVPYELMRDLDESNAELPTADVALVVGANDVTNPAARRPDSAIHGMPILDVDKARSVVVLKRSMGHGYAGIDNELYVNPRTGMYFCDAKVGIVAINAALKELVH